MHKTNIFSNFPGLDGHIPRATDKSTWVEEDTTGNDILVTAENALRFTGLVVPDSQTMVLAAGNHGGTVTRYFDASNACRMATEEVKDVNTIVVHFNF